MAEVSWWHFGGRGLYSLSSLEYPKKTKKKTHTYTADKFKLSPATTHTYTAKLSPAARSNTHTYTHKRID
jgi:hypothetical protein